MKNALQGRNKTLGALMNELRGRLGYVSAGPASKGNDATMKSFLQEAHDYVYGELQPPQRRTRSIIKLQANSRLYDWHDDKDDLDIDPDTVEAVWVRWPDSTQVDKLCVGISERERADSAMLAMPERYDTLDGQLELYPTPHQALDLVIEHMAGIGRFEQATDRTSVPHRLVFLYALANAKAHYRHPDAQAAATSFANMLRKEKFKQKGQRRYKAASMTESRSVRQVERTSTGYSMKV